MATSGSKQYWNSKNPLKGLRKPRYWIQHGVLFFHYYLSISHTYQNAKSADGTSFQGGTTFFDPIIMFGSGIIQRKGNTCNAMQMRSSCFGTIKQGRKFHV